MCGRFALSADTGNLEKLLPELTELRWGLIPSWAKDENIGNRIINARCETLSEKPALRQLIKHKRCLVPTTGYYE